VMESDSGILTSSMWQEIRSRHAERVQEWTLPFKRRRSRGESHPVHDFLFTYYSYSVGRLESWQPALGQHIEIDSVDTPPCFSDMYFTRSNHYVFLDPVKSIDRLSSFKWIVNLLRKTQANTAIYGCYGMHEWAMVYRGEDVRHKRTAPLRLSQAETDEFVESRSIICSHYDAFRFFTKSSKDFNTLSPDTTSREEYEQGGCIHANMDLYKWAYKCMPWVGSELVWKCFLLAVDLRELDMKAAPYDLTSFGYEAILVETEDGKKEYESQQRTLADRAQALRDELIISIEEVIKSADSLKQR